MDLKITTLAGKDAGKLKLNEAIFGLDPREDILARVVRWQLAKKQQGTHKAKGRAEIARTGAKMYKQKGTGRARHHSARAPQFRGGGKAHGGPRYSGMPELGPRRYAVRRRRNRRHGQRRQHSGRLESNRRLIAERAEIIDAGQAHDPEPEALMAVAGARRGLRLRHRSYIMEESM